MKDWNGKRYHSLNYFLRNKYGEKIYKIPLDGGFTCPNRDGKVAKGGCTFCSSHGSGDFAGSRILTITEQFDDRKKVMEKKWNKGKYIAYFQAYTNTYAPIEELRDKYNQAIAEENVVALSIATRPDCLGDDVLDLLEEMSKKVYLWVELGLQTINDKTAENFNRGYKFEVFKEGIKKLQDRGIEVVVHSIFGLPGETKEDFQKTYELASKIKEISTNTTGTFRTSVFQFRPYHGTQLYNEIVKSTGIIHECEFNQSISKFEGRSQFNFDFGNYSKEKDEILSQYIIKTQELTKEEK